MSNSITSKAIDIFGRPAEKKYNKEQDKSSYYLSSEYHEELKKIYDVNSKEGFAKYQQQIFTDISKEYSPEVSLKIMELLTIYMSYDEDDVEEDGVDE